MRAQEHVRSQNNCISNLCPSLPLSLSHTHTHTHTHTATVPVAQYLPLLRCPVLLSSSSLLSFLLSFLSSFLLPFLLQSFIFSCPPMSSCPDPLSLRSRLSPPLLSSPGPQQREGSL